MEHATKNCTVAIDGTAICYVDVVENGHRHRDGSLPSSSSSSSAATTTATTIESHHHHHRHHLRHDLFIVAATIVATCIAVILYNYHLHRQIQNKAKDKKYRNVKTDINNGSNNSINNNDDDNNNDDNDNDNEAQDLITLSSKSIAASLAHIEGMQASGNFLSAIFAQMWHHTNIAVSNTIKETLEPSLKEMKVPLHFVKLDLGSVPIQTKNMFIHRVDLDTTHAGKKKKKVGIQIDVDVNWNGNCDIMLQATMSRGIKMTFGVKSIKLSGRMHILLSPLTTELPIIEAVQYGFTNPPEVQLEFTGVVKSLASLGFVQTQLVSIIQDSLASMLVLPQRMVMPLDLGSYDYFDTYQPPMGMVRLTVAFGRGFTVLQKMFLKDIPDVYCKLTLGARNPCRPAFQTTTKYDDLEPCWKDEHCDFILYDMDQKVYLDVFDEDKGPLDPDDELGKAEISVRDLFRKDGEVELELELDGVRTGCFVTVTAELFHLSKQLQSLTSAKYKGKNELCGLATIIVTRAFDIPIPKEDAATHVKVVYGEGTEHEQTFYTGTVTDYPGYDALNPMFDCAFQVPLTWAMHNERSSSSSSPKNSETNSEPRRASSSSSPSPLKSSLRSLSMRFSKVDTSKRNGITFILIDANGANGTTGHGELGRTTVTHDQLLDAYEHTVTETRVIGDGGVKLEFRVILSGIQSETEKLRWAALENKQSTVFRSLYGGMHENNVNFRITALRGRGFLIRKRRIGKKDDVPDVYCSIRLEYMGGDHHHDNRRRKDRKQQQQQKFPWKTSTIKDDTMPQWNESREFTDVDPNMHFLRVDAFDSNKGGKDDLLGSVEFSLEKLMRKRILEMELLDEGTLTSSYITLQCVQVASMEKEAGGAVPNNVGYHNNDDHALIEDDISDDEDEEEDVVAPLRRNTSPPSSHPAKKKNFNDDDNHSIGSIGSRSSISRRMFKAGKLGKSLPKKLGKRLSLRKSSKRSKE